MFKRIIQSLGSLQFYKYYSLSLLIAVLALFIFFLLDSHIFRQSYYANTLLSSGNCVILCSETLVEAAVGQVFLTIAIFGIPFIILWLLLSIFRLVRWVTR